MAALERAVQQVLALNGYEPIPKPTPEESLGRKASRFGEQIYPLEEFCGVLLISTTSKDQKWSYIKCVPDFLLCKRPNEMAHPRLAELAKILQVDAFRLDVEDGDSAVLLECRSDGEFRVSGALTSMLEEAHSPYTDEITEETSVMYFEEQAQGDEPTFELLSDLKAFSPTSFSYPEPAVQEIEAEFLALLNLALLNNDLAWIFHEHHLFTAWTANPPESGVCALYFRQEVDGSMRSSP